MLRTGGTPVTAGPMDAPTQGRRQCTAKSTTTGERCTKAPIRGGTVCATHGGSAPQVRKKAALRLLELVDQAIAVLAREMVNAAQTDRQSTRLHSSHSCSPRMPSSAST